MRLFKVIYILLLLILSGCGSDQEEGGTSTPEENLLKGWSEYNSGNYENSILAFERVLAESGQPSVLADAYNGIGWAYLGFSQSVSVNQKNIDTALSKFQEAITRDKTNADAWIGQAGLLLIRRNSQDDLANALKAIDNALQGDAKYLYRHDYDSRADLHALKAQCHYYLGELDRAQDEVNLALVMEKDNNAALALGELL